MTAKEASLAAANLGIHQFIIPQNQSTNAALPFVINYANKDTITLLMKQATVISVMYLMFCTYAFAYQFHCSWIALKEAALKMKPLEKWTKEPRTFPNTLIAKQRFHNHKNGPTDETTLMCLNFFTRDFVALSKPELFNVASGSPRCPFPKRLHSQNLIVLSKSHHSMYQKIINYKLNKSAEPLKDL